MRNLLGFRMHYLTNAGNLSLKATDCLSFGRRKMGQRYTDYERKVLLRSFLNKRKLTEETKKALSNELGLHWTFIHNFFYRMNKRPINDSIKEYKELLQSKKLNYYRKFCLTRLLNHVLPFCFTGSTIWNNFFVICPVIIIGVQNSSEQYCPFYILF